MAIITYTIVAGRSKFTPKVGQFELLALDYMLDSDLNVYLLEFNA